jgi:hypothetical protein
MISELQQTPGAQVSAKKIHTRRGESVESHTNIKGEKQI